MTLADTIRTTTSNHLTRCNGLLFGQCVTAVGWIGGTVPELSEKDGIMELSMADVAGSGIAVGAALMGRKPIYVIRYQGFMWYNAAPILNYAAKSKDIWGVPCPIFVRSIAMEGHIGPVATGSHHGMVMRMPGIPVIAPMTSNEWLIAWKWFIDNDDPIYVSEHRRSFNIDYEMHDNVEGEADITIIAISSARLNAEQAAKNLISKDIKCHLIHAIWLKPFELKNSILKSLESTHLGIVIDSDFEISSSGRSIAYEIMHKTGYKVHCMGLEDRSAGFSKKSDNGTPSVEEIEKKIISLV